MGLGNGKDSHIAVQSAIKGKVSNLWINMVIVLIVCHDREKIQALMEKCSNVHTETAVPAFMFCYLCAIYINLT